MHFANPFAHALFMPLTITACALLAAALAYALFSERKNLRDFHKSSLCSKLFSSVIVTSVSVLAILSGPGGLCLLAVAMSIVGVLEYASITSLSRRYLPIALGTAIAIPLTTALAPAFVIHVLIVALLAIATVSVFSYRTPAPDATEHEKTQIFRQAAAAMLCVAYAPLLGSFAVRLAGLYADAAGLILVLGCSVAMSDTMAFVVGKAFGRRKLAPHVSPNKTVAGCGGNAIGAYLGFLLLQFACPLPTVALVVLPLLIAAGSVVGDLFESLIKRSFGVKDAGTWLPGFGGLLDRIDSVLFVLPISYLFLSLVS